MGISWNEVDSTVHVEIQFCFQWFDFGYLRDNLWQFLRGRMSSDTNIDVGAGIPFEI